MSRPFSIRWLAVAVSAAMLLAVAAACGTETIEVPGETVVVEKSCDENGFDKKHNGKYVDHHWIHNGRELPARKMKRPKAAAVARMSVSSTAKRKTLCKRGSSLMTR